MRTDIHLPPWSARLIDDLDAADRRANGVARGLSAEQLNWTPGDTSWSVGQCLEHLCAATDVYLPAIGAALDRASPAPVDDITPGWFGRWFIRTYIEPSAESRRARAPRKIAPARRIETSVLERFVGRNAIARDVVRRASAYDVNRIRFRNPLVPVIRFTVGTGLQILCRHQHRHLLQAERIRQSLSFPKA